ncbi:MAG TPA: GDSL-type esterase/lipase family protein, partial [Planctomycetota bacterium]|nr:GDSL-type esterase/lipase family protein [Planctomycetota bacterium]
MHQSIRLALISACAFGALGVAADSAPMKLNQGDHVAIIGGGVADRMQHDGTLEAMLYKANPTADLVFRNLGFMGDEVDNRMRSEDFGSPEDWLKRVKADVVWAFFGFNESFAGKDGIADFKGKLHGLIHSTIAADYSGKGKARLVLFSPTAAEKGTDPDWQDVTAINANLTLYSAAIAEVAKEMDVPFVDLFAISKEAYAKAKSPLTVNGLHLTEAGYEAIAPDLFKALAGTNAPAVDGDLKRIRAAVQERNAWFFSRYRTPDGYNVYGGRSHLTFDGITNNKVMQEEMAVRDVMTANRDRVVWAAAQGKTIAATDDNLPAITQVKTNKPDAKPYLDAEAGIAKMTVPMGVKVNVFATEEKFPELVNPVQMAWDAKGRLWVASWKTYPERTPSDTKGDSILIFEDTDHDGKADKCITFMDQLNCPTGFQFHKDGILLMQAPDLWYITIDPKTGLAGQKSRVVGGLDSADSHHQTNAMCYSPGGATFCSDGVFHRSQVETHQGVVRNYDAAIYRFEPRTFKFERYIAYGFANPHGRIFDRWGNDFVTDATGNNNYWGVAISTRLEGAGAKHPGVKNFWQNPSRPCPGTGILSSSAWPAEYDGNFLNLNVIGMQGIFRATTEEDGSGIKGTSKENFLSSSDPNFRPTAVNVGPDGAVYVADWSNAIIGHMQHHLRDPVRDHGHGRLYRVTYEGKTITPPVIAGQPIEKLLDLLKAHEDGTRELAKVELGRYETAKVMAALDRWVAALDPKEAEYQHHLTEALWTKQWHNVVDTVLLKKQLRSPDYRARAAATNILCYQHDRITDALALLKVQVTDESPRVRVEAVRALSFFEQWEAADLALLSLTQPGDYYLDYVLKETMRQLERWWKPAITDGKPIAKDNPTGLGYILAGVPTAALAKLPPSEGVWQAMFSRSDAPFEMRQQALAALAKKRNATPLATLLDLMQPLLKDGGKALEDACALLVQQPAADLVKGRDTLGWLTKAGQLTEARQAGIAALMIADGAIDTQWNAAGNEPLALIDRLNAVAMIPDVKLRAAAAPKILPLLGAWPADLGAALGKAKGAAGRYVRIQLPRKATLTLAEVEVFSGGVNIAGRGKANQSSTAYGGDARRAIDGKTDGSFGAGTSTHTNETEDKPWWEVDLGSPQIIESVKVWNRTDGDLGKRLDQFDVVVFDDGRQEVARSSGNPAPSPSASIVLSQDAAGALRRAAITAALTIGGDQAVVAGALQDLLAKGEQVSAASEGLRTLGKATWVAAKAGSAVAGIAAWARGLSTEGRTAPDVKRVLEVGDQLAGLLAGDEATKAKADLSSLSVRVIVLKTVREQMRYDQPKLTVEAGKPFAIELVNEDMMPHNLVVVAPGSRQEIALLAQVMPIDKPDKLGRVLIPENPKVLGATKLINPDKRELLLLNAPEQEKSYEYVCTFPGH